MSQRIVLGMGAGQCGLNLLFEILAKQASSRMTMDQAPVLPWTLDPKENRVKERLARWKKQLQERFVGDVATFYLPYVEQFIAEEPDCRLICLKRPREEVVASFCKYLDEKAPNPTDHWSDEPAAGWYHDPIWSRAFPQYPVHDRVEGCGLYWEELLPPGGRPGSAFSQELPAAGCGCSDFGTRRSGSSGLCGGAER